MLNSIELFNFESHKHSLIKFDSNFHVITGDSDCGKSGIRRALFWIMLNKGKKKSFRSWWCEGEDETKVIVKIDDHTITRLVTKTRNEYKLDDETFHAFGTNVPEPIVKLFNINEINTGSQFEGHFLLSKSAGEVAKFFNKIIGLNKIDTTVKSIKSIKSDKKSTIQVLDKEQKENEYLIDEYGDYTKVNKRIRVVKKVISSIDTLVNDITKLEEYHNAMQKSISFIEANSSFVKVNKLIRKYEKASTQKDEVQKFTSSLIYSVGSLEESYTKFGKWKDRPPLLKKITELKFTIEEQDACENDLGKMHDKFIELDKAYKSCNEVTINYREDKANLEKHMKGVCPLCEK